MNTLHCRKKACGQTEESNKENTLQDCSQTVAFIQYNLKHVEIFAHKGEQDQLETIPWLARHSGALLTTTINI